jgi:hypothetical protein
MIKVDEIDFHDVKVKIYYDSQNLNNNVMISWRARNPDAFYKGLVYLGKDGKITYPEGTIIPIPTTRDREMLPMSIITGQENIDDEMRHDLLTRIESDYKRRNSEIVINDERKRKLDYILDDMPFELAKK